MEVLGGVASVISVITLALQSTKTIYEFASSIKHGSDDINRLARATENLETLLKATKRLAERAERTITVAEGKLLEDLQPLVGKCADALREIPPKLVQLHKDSRDGRLRKAKKYAKAYLDTKGVAEIWNTVNHYVELLGSCLGNASVDVGLYNAQKLHLLHDELSAASLDNKSHSSHVEEVLRDQRALAQAGLDAFRAELRHESLDARLAATTQTRGIAEVKTWQQQFGKDAIVGYENIRTDVQNLRDTIDDRSHRATIRSEALMTDVREGMSETTNTSFAQIEEVRRMREEVTQKLHSISDRLETIPSIASEQLSTLQSLVEMLSRMHLEARTGDQKLLKRPRSEAYIIGNDRCNDSDSNSDSDLGIEGLLARICHFANAKTTCRHSKEAQSVIDDIGRLLGLVMQHFSVMSPSHDELVRKGKFLCDHQYSELETAVQSMENLGKAKRALTASQRVRISNQDSRPTRNGDYLAILLPGYTPNSRHQNSRRRRVPTSDLQSSVRSWTLRHGRLDAIFRTKLLPDAEDNAGSADGAFTAKLLITPTSAQHSTFQIVIDLASKIYQNRSIHLMPTLTFRAMVPDDSEVFRVVKGGSVKKLKKLISSGRASLGDCDSMGRSLLNFALWKCRRRMTSFLIQSGADVDTLEPAQERLSHYLVKPLSMFQPISDEYSVAEDRERVEACYKLVLDAGSDNSSVVIADNLLSAFSVALAIGYLSEVKALIDLGEPFISLECTGDNSPYGAIPLLILAYCHSQRLNASFQMTETVALLLSRGANVKARNSDGKTCLHLVLSQHVHRGYCWCDDGARVWRHSCRTKDIVILMISAGADVCAIDEEGWSVSDLAISSGQYSLWTEALKYCGIDIRDVLARPNVDPARSTALSSEYSQPHRSVTSKVSLEEYLERRKAFRVPEENEIASIEALLDSSEDDDSGDEESEHDESEKHDFAEEMSEAFEEDVNESDDEDHKRPVQYGGGMAKGKAKLD